MIIDMIKKIKLAIGFICYGESTAKYLPQFLPSLKEAIRHAGCEARIWAWDNLPAHPANHEFIDKFYPDIIVEKSGANVGFGCAYNRMIASATDWEADYFLVTNPDTFWGKHSIEKLLSALELDDRLGSVAPKVYYWDYARQQGTKIIDTCGVIADSGLHFHDLGQTEPDRHQYDSARITGPSGCAGIYRLDALRSVRQGQEYFDELMFMYKEDADLAVRLRLAGWNSEMIAEANVWHDRSVAGQGNSLWGFWKAWRSKSRATQKWAFRNQLILYYKYWRWESLGSLLKMSWHLGLRLTYAGLFDKELWREVEEFWRLRKRIRQPLRNKKH